MKKIALFAILFIFCFMQTYSEEPKGFQNVTYLNEKHKTNRPRIPAKRYLICYYASGFITLKIPNENQFIELTLIDKNQPIWSGYVSIENPSCVIPTLTGEYTLECVTDQNQVFTGILYF